MLNALSIDVEDWYCVYNLSGVIQKKEWHKYESRVLSNTEKLLSILKTHNTKATFFILGWIAEKYPAIVRKIDEEGHEIATHGYSHTLLTSLTPDEFDKDLARSIEIIKKCTNQDIIGFRAPSFSITAKTLWALDILVKHGIQYDSSIFPIGFHPDYGVNKSPLQPYQIGENIIEFPLSCFEVLGGRFPCCGGGYFRLFPYFYTRFGINQCNRNGRPVVFYLHPWEIDPDQPRVKLPFFKKIRHYSNLAETEKRLRRLLQDFRFATIKSVLGL